MTISIHLASEEERRTAHRNTFEVWGGEYSLDAYLERCFSSLRHNRAQWWVLTEHEEVVASLGLHPLAFRYGENICSGFGFGSVHTRADRRRQGYAMALCRRAMAAAQDKGCQFGLLFSDIKPAYYAQLGFQLCPHQRFTCTDINLLASDGERCGVEVFDGHENIDFLVDCYRTCHRDDSLAFWRDKSEWSFLIDSHSDLQFLRLLDQNGDALGYAWIHLKGDQLVPVEVVLFMTTTRVMTQAYRALAVFGQSQSISKMSSWIAPPSTLLPYFSVGHRTKAMPMLWTAAEGRTAQSLPNTLRIYSSVYF